MRRWLVSLVLFVLIVPITYAQSGCHIELEDTILRLIQAQRAADTGDDLTASSILTSVQGELEQMLSGCDTVRLTEKFVNPDETLAFSYPEGWQVRMLDSGFYVVVTSSELIDLLDSDLPEEIAPGEAAIALQTEPLGDDTFDSMLEDVLDDMLRDFAMLGQMSDTTIRGRRYASVNVSLNENVSGRIGLIDFSDAEIPSVVLVFGLADHDSLPIIEVYTDALMQSIQYPPVDSLRTPGVALDTLSYSAAVELRGRDDIDAGSHMILSPDGSQIGYQSGDGICIYDIESSKQDCTPVPERFRGRSPLLQWSPDGRYIMFQEDALRMFIDADVWLYNVEEQVITDLTDDGDAKFGIGKIETDVWLDSASTWGPDNLIYLLRTSFEAGGTMDTSTYELIQIDPDSGESNIIQDLTGQFNIFPVFYAEGYSLDGVMAVSPDATQMVISVYEQDRDSINNGLWLLDLKGIEEPQKLASINDFKAGYSPEMYAETGIRVIESIAWDADGTGLYVYATSPAMVVSLPMTYHMDLGTGEIVPMADLSAYSMSELLSLENDTMLPATLMIQNPVLAPDFGGIIGISGIESDVFVTAIPFDNKPGEPIILYDVGEKIFAGDSSTVASDGTMILIGVLFQPD